MTFRISLDLGLDRESRDFEKRHKKPMDRRTSESRTVYWLLQVETLTFAVFPTAATRTRKPIDRNDDQQ